jgi:hypothetical protein
VDSSSSMWHTLYHNQCNECVITWQYVRVHQLNKYLKNKPTCDHLHTLYTARAPTQFSSMKPSKWSNFINFLWGPTLSHVKWRGPILGPDVLKGKVSVQRINLLWIDGRDIQYTSEEPTPIHVESTGWEKPRPEFFKWVQRFDANFLPPRTPH